MNIRIAFRGMDHSDLAEKYANKELEKLTKYLNQDLEPLYIDLVLQADHNNTHHKVELRLNGKNLHLMASREGKDLYQEIDHVVKVMGKELKKHKGKALDKRNHPGTPKDSF
ncbi:MAG: ribosomal subunit interface protein [Alteromonas naphthalenivorans]|jgi:ribosomal subunit interface protein